MVKYVVIFAIVTLLAFGVADIFRKKAAVEGADPSTYLMVESIFAGGFALLAALILGRGLSFNAPALVYAPITGLLVVVGLVSLLTGLALGEASTLVPVARLGFVLTFVLALALFGESLTALKVLGIAFAVLAVLFLST